MVLWVTMKPMQLTFYVISALIIIVSTVVFFVTKNSTQSTVSHGNRNTSQTERASYTIIAFGDSLTAGYGVSLEESYPYILEQELLKRDKNIRVLNMGVSGEVTTAGLERVEFVLAQKPSLVLLGLGANDMLRASSPEITRTNLEIIIERFKEADVPIILLGMKSVASNGEEYRAVFDSIYPFLAKKYAIPLVPFFLEGVALNPRLNTPDGIHPNKAGYEKIVQDNILPVLLPTL